MVHLEDGSFLHANIVVLATGNTKPAELKIAHSSFPESKKYFSNPWTKECVSDLETTKDILIIGNGLTMIDTVLGLLENGFKHTIHTISPMVFICCRINTIYSSMIQLQRSYHKNTHYMVS